MKLNSGNNRRRWLAVMFVITFSLQSFAQNNGAPARPGGDVFSTSGKGNSTKTTGTQGVNHGKGGNTTKKTGKNIPSGLPDVFNTKGGNKGGPILSGGGNGGAAGDVFGTIIKPGKGTGTSTPLKTQPIPGLPGRWTCVDLKNSPYSWDRKVANLNDSDYNCHYYTRAAMGLSSNWGAMTDLNTKSLPKLGYKQVNPAEAKIGDIILIEEPAQGGGVSLGFSHSGVVTDAVNGIINNIRQKASPQHCVIDTSFYDFKKAFVSDLKYITLWRKN